MEEGKEGGESEQDEGGRKRKKGIGRKGIEEGKARMN